MKLSRPLHLGVVCMAFLGAVLSCSSPSSASSGSGTSAAGSGSGTSTGAASTGLVLNFADNFSRTLVPALSMTAASYTVSGVGPTTTFNQTGVTGTSYTAPNLETGAWTVTVQAYNAASTLIGSGSAATTVTVGSATGVTVSVVPISGTGTLGLTVTWSGATSGAAFTSAPTIVATLSPAIGSTLTGWTGLPASGGGAAASGTASYNNASVATGYSTLLLAMMDGATTKASLVDVARIVNGQTTSGTYTFSNWNTAGGSIPVTISANMQNPLTMTVSGAGTTTLASISSVTTNATLAAAFSSGNTETFTVGASGFTGIGTPTYVYVWYKDGVNVGTTTTYAYTAAKPSGYSSTYYCNIAAVAFTSDGSQAGVVNFYVSVN